jgi:hypothetical protein
MSGVQASKIPDVVTVTRSEFIKRKYDSVGLAQLYPDYEVVNQYVRARRMVEDTSYVIESDLELPTPNPSEPTGVNHPLETSAPKQHRTLSTRLVTFRTPFTWSEFEKTFQGKDETKLVDIIQGRFTKNDRDHWELLENLLLATDFETAIEDKFRSLFYWITGNPAITTAGTAYSQYGGLDPIASGRAGITVASQEKFTNAVAAFDKVSQDDYFDKLSKFLNSVKMQALVPHPQVAPEAPSRVNYVQDPVKRAVERILQASNENTGEDAGFYRNASYYRGVPIVLWHALSSPESPVRPVTGTSLLVDWNTMLIQVHSDWNRRSLNGDVANTPAQHWEALFSMLNIHCTRPDRNLFLQTDAPDLQPDAV